MIEINTLDSIKMSSNLQLNTKRAGINPFASIDEMSQVDDQNKIENPFNTPDELMEGLQLDKVEKRFQILSLIPREEQDKLIYLLSDEAMCLGMKLYSKEKILNFLLDTPQKDISKVLTEVLPEEKIFELIPEKFLDKFLVNEDLDKKDFIKGLEKFDPNDLKELIESLLGLPQDGKTPKEMIDLVQSIPMDKLQPMFLTIEPEQKSLLIANMMKENKDLYELFPSAHLLIPLEENDKQMTIDGLAGLDTELVGGMLEKLPDELMPVLLTLIDPEVLAQKLMEVYPEIIMAALSLGND